MSRLVKLALGALIALSLAAVLVVGCSDDEQSQQQQQQAQPEQQQESEAAAPSQSSAAQEQQQQQQAQPQAVSAEPLKVVTSTQIIADWVRQIGGDHVEVQALVPAGADVHTIELSVSDIRAVAGADLVIINGAGLEASYQDAILENSDHVLDLAEAIENAGLELAPFSEAMAHHDDHDGHDDEDEHAHEDDDDHGHDDEDDHGHEDEDGHDHDDHGAAEAIGRLIVADALEAHLSVIDLSTEEVDSGVFAVAAPGATVYPSPTHRFAIVLARGPEPDDDRIHIFDGGIFLVEHGDHYDLVSEPVSRHSLEIAEELPIHYVNSHGWTSIFADTNGHVILINEHDLTTAQGDYEPIVLEAGPHHGAALVMTDEHVVVTTKNPDDPNDQLPVGVEVWTFDGEVVYDASNRSCPGMHGEAHNEHGAVFGCAGGVLFLHAHDGEYEHEFIANPPEMREGSRVMVVYGHHQGEHFFGHAFNFGSEGFADDGIWLVDVAHGEMRQVFSETSVVPSIFSSDGEQLFVLGADGVLHVLDAHDGDLVATMDLVEPTEAGPGEAANPAMVVVGEWLYVSDPNAGHVLAVHLSHMEIEEEWHVGGAPGTLAFVGVLDRDGSPHAGHDEDEMHDEDEHDHEQDEEHEHEDEHEEDDHGHAHHHGDEDPHYWFDTDLASVAIAAIADELSHLSPDAADVFSDRLEDYLAEIAEADAEVRELLAGISDSQRLLVTFHDAFGYFARRYGLEVAGFVVEGPEQGVSAEALAELIELIEHEGVETIFHEPQFDASIIDTVAEESGAKRGIIWSQPTEDNPTYIGILVGNARAIAEQ
ncbi:MAG: zinc ABC transporter substrate-binding protein [Chloroflexi bacterium]|nr:zinc ABC transporter substrate-binding protein [Chloroflexota bacterium]